MFVRQHTLAFVVAVLQRHYLINVPRLEPATETGWSAKADEARFLAVSPGAMPPDPSRRSQFSPNPPYWNPHQRRELPQA